MLSRSARVRLYNGRAALRSRQLEARRATRRRCDAARHCQRLRRQAPGSCSARTIVWTASLHENLPLECGGLAAFFDEWHLTLRIATHHTLMYTFFVVHGWVKSHIQHAITVILNIDQLFLFSTSPSADVFSTSHASAGQACRCELNVAVSSCDLESRIVPW